MPYPAIVTPADLSAAQSGDLDWLSLQATKAIRSFCRWHVAPVITETLTLDTDCGPNILLPTMRLTGVTSATLDGEDILADLDWSAAGVLKRKSCRDFPETYRSLVINIEHGYEIEETPLVGLIAELTARAKIAPAGVVTRNRTAGPFSEQLGFAQAPGGGTPGLKLLDAERAQLAPYVLTWGP